MRILTKNADLFDKAIGDLWMAELSYKIRPDYAIWHCSQSVEKMLKGIIQCYGKEYDHTHDLLKLLKDCTNINIVVEDDIIDKVHDINRFANSVRYTNRGTDVDQQSAKNVVQETREVLGTLAMLSKVKEPYQEALQLHNKMLKNQESLDRQNQEG